MWKSEADTSQIILPFNFSRSAPNLTSSSSTYTLTIVSTAAEAVSMKRLFDGQHRSHVVQASLCSVSSSGFPPNSMYQPSCGVIVDVTVRINKSRHRGGQPLSSGQGSLASSPPCLLVAELHMPIFILFYRAERSLRTRGNSASLTQDMALNRAQMLVRDSETLAQFRVDHRIPDDPRKNPETQMLEGNHYLRLRKPNQPQTRLVTDSPNKDQYLNDFIWVSGQWSSLLTNPTPSQFLGIGDSIDAFGGGAIGVRPQFSADIDLGDEALNEEAEVEDGEEVDQIPTAAPLVSAPLVLVPEPTNLPSSNSDVAIVESREIVKHSYSHSDSSSAGSQLNAEIMAPKPAEGTSRPKRRKGAGSAAGTPELWAPQFAAVELGKQVTSADTSKDHETCVALGNAVMLPQDVADHAAENHSRIRGQAHYAGGPAEIAILQQNHAQQEASDLKAFACGEVYKKLFDRAFERGRGRELQIPLDHPAWSSPAPPVQLPASPERYSPINLPDFNEEEYATLPADEGNTNTVIVEAHVGIAETADRDRAREAEGDRAFEAEGENLV
ncbi:hypothetical protein Acr_00g0009680 [Actinidia rufa]|uniref:Uncharacterized protein n=1 Tax=Actinidia rufa TaxID=165716 RepID=A0A7J0D963_9ERIC|nr:hypothetical protein Acr_00g0009680 [Actinidia rufa]